MSTETINLAGTGLEVMDLHSDPRFMKHGARVHDAASQVEGLQRLARAFVDTPENLLQELVDAAVRLCGADSAGISTQNFNERGEIYYHWVATTGAYAKFFDAILPSHPSACGVCLERGRPQIFRVSQAFFDLMGITAPVVTDGLLLPWEVAGVRGTIWIMAHGRTDAFDAEDLRLMEVFANFAAMAARQQTQQKKLMEQASAASAAAMANDLAHNINNPLQSLTNLVYLAAHGRESGDAKTFAQAMSEDLNRLSALVRKLLALPVNAAREISSAP